MPKCDKLLTKARESPSNLRYEELCALAACWGYEPKKGGTGSHRKWKHRDFKLPARYAMLVFQDNKGKAVDYQIKQLLEAIAVIEEQHPGCYPV